MPRLAEVPRAVPRPVCGEPLYINIALEFHGGGEPARKTFFLEVLLGSFIKVSIRIAL